MLLDSSKFGVKSLMNVLELEEMSLFITDEDAPAELIEELQQRGVKVQIAPDPHYDILSEHDGWVTGLTSGSA